MSGPTVPAPTTTTAGRARKLINGRIASLFLILALAIGITAAVNPRFLGGSGFTDLLIGSAVIGILAVGLTPVVIARHIDLSIASTTGLSAYVTLSIVVPNGWGLWQSFAIGAGIGLLVGTVNGLLVAGLNIPSLVVTLGTLSIVRGILYFYSDAGRFTPDVIPPSLIAMGLDTILDIPIIFWITLGFALFAAWWMRYTPVGRDLYAIGSNPPAAQLVGINIFQRTLLAFIWSGLMAGIAGVLYIGQFAFVDASAFINQELAVVTAVVVGGVNIFGGSGTIIGALLGALLIRVIAGGLVAVGVDPFWQQAVNGVLLITAIGLDRILALRSQAKIQRIREDRVEERSWRE